MKTLLIIAGFIILIVLFLSNENSHPPTTVHQDSAKQAETNGQQYAPVYRFPEVTPQEVELERLNIAAIELCKAETVKRQPNAKDFVAKGHSYKVSQKDVFHVSVDWGLGGMDPAMVSDCRIASKNDKMTLTKIKFTFAN